ncbi:hypothetical protein QQ045_007463 [Rhodiola kirilowii]
MVDSSSSAMARHLLMAFFLISCVAAAEVRRELTTRSWDAIGFHEDAKRSPLEENIIIGVVDSGIWPESPSFSDVGLPPPPQKWKGICQPNNFSFTCNNKIIGARFYVPDPERYFMDESDEVSPRDNDGHGTHVAATVAGVPVKGVSVQGLGLGTARGALPRARIAVYKTCWNSNDGQCFYLDKAIDDAVRDGVDIITLSIGGPISKYFNRDQGAIAAFNAMKQGVLVSYSAGNSGPKPFMMDNLAPWMLTVGNSFTGPSYESFIKLGNGKSIKGQLPVERSHEALFPLVKSLDVSVVMEGTKLAGMMCKPEFLDPILSQGKIVLCPLILGNFRNITAAGIIYDAGSQYENMRGYYSRKISGVTVVAVTSQDYAYLVSYYNEKGTASILKTEEIKIDTPYPAMSSSRGPNLMDPTIMKPDLSAPGVNIIAAVIGDNATSFDSMTGTSMAAPHATGIAAYVKSFHPEWSPSAIKSALLTTATPMVNDNNGNVSELAYGAGNLNPVAAADPGLVYDLQLDDYLKYVCIWSENDAQAAKNITRDPNFNCSSIKVEQNWSLNLPTFSIPAKPNTPFVKVFRRSVKNVGSPISNYKAIVSAPAGVEIQLQPSVLSFDKVDQVLFFDVTVKGQFPDKTEALSASFVWTDGHHHVRSPIVIFNDSNLARVCSPENLDSKLIQGKIILCPSVSRYNFGNITAAGIIFDAGGELYEDMRGRYYAIDTRTRTLPVIGVTGEDFAYLLGYYNETTYVGNATASILKTEEIKNESPPFPAMSSSRGPNLIDPTIMKPDLSAPGVNIIAAVIGNPASFDCRTGTSMATPHASGIAGYVKTFHPSWSPSAIKSALLTTATPMINDKYNNVSELAYGAGNLNPVAAVNPGLVYDLQVDDYVKYLCKWSQNYDEAVKNITRDPNVNCSSINMEENWSLNLPTFSIPAKPNTPFIKVFRRSVKNVGSPISNYKSIVSAPAGVEIQLQPSVLSFEKLDQVLSYDVTIKGQIPDNSTVLSASLVWTDGHHHVRSPIVIFPEFDINAVYKKIVEDLMAGMHAADPDDLLTIV